MENTTCMLHIYKSQTLRIIVTKLIFKKERHLFDYWCLMASSNALLVLGVFMLLMTTFVAGDVADTIRHNHHT